jgi:hypothetical protein
MPSSPGVFPDLKALIASRSFSSVHFTLLIVKTSIQLASVRGE